jgi:hypothetical protein
MDRDALQVIMVDVADLHELPDNPRNGDVEAVCKSYERFGQRKPIVARHNADGQLVVYSGNHQLKAVKLLGWSQMAVHLADDLTEEEALAFALADNRVSDLGTYDSKLMQLALDSISHNPALVEASSMTDLVKEDLSDLPDFEDFDWPMPKDKSEQKSTVACPECGCEFVP